MDSKWIYDAVAVANGGDVSRREEALKELLGAFTSILAKREAIYRKYGAEAPWSGASRFHFALSPHIYDVDGEKTIPLSFQSGGRTGQVDVALSWFDGDDSELERLVYATRTAELESEVERKKAEYESSLKSLECHLKLKERP